MSTFFTRFYAVVLASATGVAAAELAAACVGLLRGLPMNEFPFRGVGILALMFSVLAAVGWAVVATQSRRDAWGVSLIFAFGTGCMCAFISAIQFNRFDDLHLFVLIMGGMSLIFGLAVCIFMQVTGMCDRKVTSSK